MKYMAGFETGGGNVINPSQPEESAEILRSLSSEHYTRRSI
jgi:UDPglucose--hexose-1-phosphate uridylyltransferase